MQSPTTRLSNLGLSLPPIEAEPDNQRPTLVDAGNRLLVGPVFPYDLPDGPLPRLSAAENPGEGTKLEDLADDHPIRRAFVITRLTTLRMLAHVAHDVGGLDEVAKCLRLQISVRAGPNFHRLGLVALPATRIHLELFDTAPVVSLIGVAALPGGASLAMDAEYLLHDV